MHPFRTWEFSKPCVIDFILRCMHYCLVQALRRCQGDHQRRGAGLLSQRRGKDRQLPERNEDIFMAASTAEHTHSSSP